jgi:hypothetical protein
LDEAHSKGEMGDVRYYWDTGINYGSSIPFAGTPVSIGRLGYDIADGIING